MTFAPTVYFLQSEPPEGPVKIGYTRRKVTDRVAEAQTFSANRIVVLAETLGSREEEATLHRVFAAQRLSGEWFRYDPPLRDLVCYLHEGGTLQSWLDHCIDP